MNPLSPCYQAVGVLVNDVHSQLNATWMNRVVRPPNLGEIVRALSRAGNEGLPIIAAGSRRAMGGQQFCARGCHPSFASFLGSRRKRDPEEVFTSEWYRRYRDDFTAPAVEILEVLA